MTVYIYIDIYTLQLCIVDLTQRGCHTLRRIMVLYMKTNIQFWPYLAQFFLQWKMFQMTVVENITTHILFSITFYRKSCLWRHNVEKYRKAAQTTWLHDACAFHDRYLRQQHTPRLCDTCSFSVTKTVARNHLDVTLNVHWLVLLLLISP